MNDIKFRAWDKEDFKVRQVLGMSFQHGAISVELNNEKYLQDDASRFELMQYTGLKDKNGIEIYEGDALIKDGYWSFYIGFHEGAFVKIPCDSVQRVNWEWKRLTQHDVDFYNTNKNIYENPELLGDSQ